MSTERDHTRRTRTRNTVRNTMECTHSICEHGAPGHALRPLQARIAAATPSKWSDAIVRSVTTGGWIAIDRIDSADTVWLWHHSDLSDRLRAGDPVALHGLYGTLAFGGQLVNVLEAPAVPSAEG
ncbi:hypothetical protein GCM10027416_29890 [Okibacterium endophyticum]